MRLVEEGAERDVEILWGCHGETAQLGRLSDQALPGRLQPYVGVDVNQLLPEVESAVRQRLKPTSSRAKGTGDTRQQVTAFEDVDRQFIASHLARDSSPINAISYFDGRPPNWVDALGSRAPRLDRTREIEDVLSQRLGAHLAFLLSGPTGEGKSTMLRQIAGRLAEGPKNRVLWMSAGSGFKPSDVTGLTSTSSTVWVVLDDADLYVRAVAASIEGLDAAGRSDVRFLLAARDGDWTRAIQLESANIPSRLLRTFEVGGISKTDAVQIADAWSQFGVRALGKVAALAPADRAAALFEASQGSSEGALLGAMLETRYGNDFRQHIWELMNRLSRVKLPDGRTLLMAYGAICVFFHYDVTKLTLAHLSAWLEISESDVVGLVVFRLGREAAAERHGDSVIPRHRRIAREVVELLPEFSIHETDLMREVVKCAVQNARGSHWDDEMLSIAYAGQRLAKKALAIAAADGAVAGDPGQLRLINYRLGVYRDFEELDDAMSIAQGAWGSLDGFNDAKLTLRKFLVSWARVAGQLGRYQDSAALNACALLDAPELGVLTRDDATRGLSGIAWSLGMLNERIKHSTGTGACAESALYIAPTPELREQATRYLSDAERDGYVVLEEAKQRNAVSATVRESILAARIAPARRFSSQARTITQLLQLIAL